MTTVKAEILHGMVEHADMDAEPMKSGKRVRTVSKKGAVVKMDKDEFEGLKNLKAVRKATGEVAPAPVDEEASVGATAAAPVASSKKDR